MTREEAIINLKLSQNRIGGIKKEEWIALQMAIEALQTEGENGEGVVAYVCDNRKCGGDCDNCGRTTDIAHAKNFTRISDSYFERLDSVSVVRCKDCKWYKACKVFSNNAWHDDDYCSYGERREL